MTGNRFRHRKNDRTRRLLSGRPSTGADCFCWWATSQPARMFRPTELCIKVRLWDAVKNFQRRRGRIRMDESARKHWPNLNVPITSRVGRCN